MRSILNFAMALGKTSIEVYEWKESDVQKVRLSNSPDFYKLTKKLPDLVFSGWDLAHAVVKADYLDRRNLTMPGLGFLLQSTDLIDFSKSPIQLKAGASKSLNDFSFTSLSGRVGQGLAILYGHQLGLNFSAHLRSHVESQPAGSPCLKHKGKAMADFIFADNSKTVLIESKSSFSLKDNDPSAIKSILKAALNAQVDPWMNYLKPSPSNGYVVYSCLRENSWGAPSAISIVDPNGEEGDTSDIPFSLEQVVRENYGAWLRAMGLPQAAQRLISPPGIYDAQGFKEHIVEAKFLVCEYDGRLFAMSNETYDSLEYLYLLDDSVALFGIELSVLEAISKVIQNPNLMLIELLAELPSKMQVTQESASIFPDGSFFGLISPTYCHTEVFRL